MVENDEKESLEARIRDLERVLRQNDKSTAVTFQLPPRLNNILGLLLSVPLVTGEMLEQRLEITCYTKQSMYQLRKRLARYGVEIKGIRKTGYYLEPPTKLKILRMVAGEIDVYEQDASTHRSNHPQL